VYAYFSNSQFEKVRRNVGVVHFLEVVVGHIVVVGVVLVEVADGCVGAEAVGVARQARCHDRVEDVSVYVEGAKQCTF